MNNTQQISGFVGKFQNYEKAIVKLREIFVLYKEDPSNEIYQDCLIKRYEFTWELAWKTLKEYMEEIGEGVSPNPKMTLKKAFQLDIIGDNEQWQVMAEARNTTSHEYDEGGAKAIATEILNNYYQSLQDLYTKLKHIYDTEYK